MNSQPDDNKDRRTFFREALRSAITPVSDYLEKQEFVGHSQTELRPPGAIEESLFRDTCQGSGACVRACPANAIVLAPNPANQGSSLAVIQADQAACVLCDGLLCTHVCPSGALRPQHDPAEVNIGLAEVYQPLCLREQEESCTLCVDRCPIGDTALRFVGTGAPRVFSEGCTGCGICQLYCPTSPKAIVVKPN